MNPFRFINRSIPIRASGFLRNSSSEVVVAKDSEVKAVIYSIPKNPKTLNAVSLVNGIALAKKGFLRDIVIPFKIAQSPFEVIKFANSSQELEQKQRNPYRSLRAVNYDLEGWQKFLEHLEPSAVSNLGLDQASKNIEYYNYCLPQFGSEIASSDYQRSVRNRSKLIGTFPLIMKIIEDGRSRGVDDAWNEGLELLTECQFDNSRARKKLQKYLGLEMPIRNGVLRRIAKAPSLSCATTFSQIIEAAVQNENGDFDHSKYDTVISNTPLPRDERYEDMWNVIRKLNECDLSVRVKSKIFTNVGRDWKKNSSILSADFKELVLRYSAAIAEDLLLPVYIREFYKALQEYSFTKYPPNLLERYDDKFTSYVRGQLINFVNEEVLSKLTPQKLVGYANRLDRMTAVIDQAKPVFVERKKKFEESGQEFPQQWHKIFPDQEINGCTFKVLSCEQELLREGREMENCVISMQTRCMNGFCHVVSGKSPEGERFSIRFNANANTIEMYEAKGVRNKGISEGVAIAVRTLCERIDRKEIPLNPLKGNIRKNSEIADMIGFSPLDEQVSEVVFQAYKAARIMPKELVEIMSNPHEFSQKIGFTNFLAQNIKKHKKESLNPSATIYSATCMSPYSHRDRVCPD